MLAPMSKPVPILIVGPSGVGKNAIIDRIVPMFAELDFFKTTTSRPKRTPTEDKYHFVSREEFMRLVQSGQMLEWAENHGNLYGAQRRHVQELLDAGKYPVPMSAVDAVKGVPAYTRLFPGTLTIFIRYESLDQLANRLVGTRPEITPEEVQVRLTTAKEEMAVIDQFKHVVTNRQGQLPKTIEEVAQIIEHELGLTRKGEAS